MIITKEEICKKVSIVLKEKIKVESFEYYDFQNFKSPSSEETFCLISVSKSNCKELIKFWIKGFEKIIEFEERYEGEADYLEWYETNILEVDESKFLNEFKSMTSNLNKNVKSIDKPLRYYQVKCDWNERIFILESKTEFLMVYWDTAV